jgi:hypothetical protein
MDIGEPQPGTALLGGPEPFTVDSDTTPTRPWRTTLRRQFMPLPVAGLLWCAATVAHAAPETWPVAAPSAVAVYFVAAVAFWTSWAAEHPETRAQRRRWATTVIIAGGAWLLWAATFGPTEVATLLLAGGGAALMLPYWTRNSPWQPHLDHDDEEALEELPEAPTLEPVEVLDSRTSTQMFWDTVVAVTVSALRGTYLCDPQVTDEFEQYTIQLAGGTQTTAGAMGAATNVASAFGRGLDTVSVLPHPSGAQDKALLRLPIANPLQTTFWYPGPEQAIDLRDGNIRVLIGYRGDGTPVWWTFYLADFGGLGGAVFGDTGSGKSELLRSLITSAAYSNLITPIVACPQGGASYPMWMNNGHWPAANIDEILRQGRALLKAHASRSVLNKLMNRDIHIPTPQAPGLIWVVDEFHKMKGNTEFYDIADTLEREGRKTFIRLLAADQDPSVPATFGNRSTLRYSLLAAQAVTLRLGGNVDSMLPGMQLDPSKLAKTFPDGTPTAGLGVLVGESEAFRVARLRDAAGLAANAPTGAIEPAVANRMGEDYTQRHARNLTDIAEAAAEMEQWDPELVAALVADNPELAAALPRVRAEQARRAAQAATQPAGTPAATVVLDVPSIPTLQLILPSPTAPPRTWTCVERVDDLLRQGITQFGELMARARKPDGTTYSETAIRGALRDLINQGRARDGGHGLFETTAA